MVNWRGKLDSREHQGCSFEFCPPPSQTNFHNTLKYPPQLVVSKFFEHLATGTKEVRVKDTVTSDARIPAVPRCQLGIGQISKRALGYG